MAQTKSQAKAKTLNALLKPANKKTQLAQTKAKDDGTAVDDYNWDDSAYNMDDYNWDDGTGANSYSWSYTSDPIYTSYSTTDYGYGSDYDDDGCYLPADTDADAYDWEYGTDYSWDTTGMGDGTSWSYTSDPVYSYSTTSTIDYGYGSQYDDDGCDLS